MIKTEYSKWKFLIIDDFSSFRLIMKCLLSDMGVKQIDEAGDGNQATKLIEKNRYDVILCDYNLGHGKDGQQVMEEAHHHHRIKYSTIFIMLTAENHMDVVMAVVEYRPDDYMTKPFTKKILMHRLEKIVAKKALFKDIHHCQDHGHFADVIGICDEMIDICPKLELDLIKIKAEASLKAGKIGLAQKIYEQALTRRDYPWARMGLGEVRMYRGEYDAAEDILLALIVDHHTCIGAYDLLAEVYRRTENNQQAQSVMMDATLLSPKVITRQRALGILAVKNNDFEVAENAFKATIKLGRYSALSSANDHVNLAKIYLKNGAQDASLGVINHCKKEYKTDKAGFLHARIMESSLYKEWDIKKGDEIFEAVKKDFSIFPGTLSQSIRQDMAQACRQFGEKRLLPSLLEEMGDDNTELSTTIRDELETERQSHKDEDYLIMNKAGKTFYKKNKLHKAMKMFEEAAYGLPDNIGVNMNAAQTALEHMEKNGFDEYTLKLARDYLDRAKSINSTNTRYLELESKYQQFIA